MSKIKVYIGCCKSDFYLLKSCIASIRYWNKDIPIYLLKDLSKGNFDTNELEVFFNISLTQTRYKKLRGYMKLQPYIEHPDERIFLQDADMLWLGDMVQVLNRIDEDIAVQAYTPIDIDTELNKWYCNLNKLKQYYPKYKYPGFVFNCGTILFTSAIFNESDFASIIKWQEGATPIYDDVFRCEDQGIINFIVAAKYFSRTVTINKIDLQITSESVDAKFYDIGKIVKKIPKYIIVHYLGNKNGLNSFCSSSHLLRFYEKQYYKKYKYGNIKMNADRGLRTIKHFDKFIYEIGKKIFYLIFSNSRKNDS